MNESALAELGAAIAIELNKIDPGAQWHLKSGPQSWITLLINSSEGFELYSDREPGRICIEP